MVQYIKVFENFVNEYLTTKLIQLKDNLSGSNDSKISKLPYTYYYLINNFFSESGRNPKEVPDKSGLDLIEWLENHDSQTYTDFAHYLYDRIMSDKLEVNFSNYPSWYFFDSNPKVVKNQWLIHFTSDAQGIVEGGFKWGANDPEKLGLTTQLEREDKSRGGYNFAFLASNFVDYYTRVSAYGLMPKYGYQAVLFRASGLETWHRGDEESQVIFYGREARNFVAIVFGKGGKWQVLNGKGRSIFEDDDISIVVNWIIDNYQQYRKSFSH
jgi:hypothetical protein